MDENEQAEAAAMQAAEAGYARKTGGAMPPAPTPQAEPPLADTAPPDAPAADAPAVTGDEPNLEAEQPPAPAPQPSDAITAQLEDLKAQVRDLKSQGVDQQTVHRLFGEIGGITRIVNKLQKQTAPTDNELAGALAAAKKAAEDYPEIGGPMLKALEALAAKLPEKDAEVETPAVPTAQAAPVAAPPASPYTPKQLAQIEALHALHPDRHEISKSTEFKQWLAAKGRDYEQKFKNSWDIALVTRGYDEFKAARAARARKQATLAAATASPGVAAPAVTVLPDAAGVQRGYDRARSKRHF